MSLCSSGASHVAMWAERVDALRARVVRRSSWVKHGRRVPGDERKASTDAAPHGSQSGVAKLDDSAQLSPCEKP
jgi:hypothetical protein